MCAASIFQIATDQSRPVPAGKEILHLSRLNAYRCLPEWKALGGTKIPAFRPKERKNAIPCPAAEHRFPNRLRATRFPICTRSRAWVAEAHFGAFVSVVRPKPATCRRSAERRFPNRLNVPLAANRLQAIHALQAVAVHLVQGAQASRVSPLASSSAWSATVWWLS